MSIESAEKTLKKSASTHRKARTKINKIRAGIKGKNLKKVDPPVADLLKEAISLEKETRASLSLLRKGIKDKKAAVRLEKDVSITISDIEAAQSRIKIQTQQIDEHEDRIFEMKAYALHLEQLLEDTKKHYQDSGEEDVNYQVDSIERTIADNDSKLKQARTLLVNMEAKLETDVNLVKKFNQSVSGVI